MKQLHQMRNRLNFKPNPSLGFISAMVVLFFASHCHRASAGLEGNDSTSEVATNSTSFENEGESTLDSGARFAFAAAAAKGHLSTEDSVAIVIADFERIHSKSSRAWMTEANHLMDSTAHAIQHLNLEISKADLQILERAAKTSLIQLGEFRRIFRDPEFGMNDEIEVGDMIQFESISSGGSAPLIAYHPILSPAWEDALFFVQSGRLLGKKIVFHHYGLTVDGFQIAGIGPVIRHNLCLESGTGIWFFVDGYWGLIDGKMALLLTRYGEVNLDMGPNSRNWLLESKQLGKNPLRYAYDWEINLGMRSTDGPSFLKGSQTLNYVAQADGTLAPDFGKGPLDAERMASFSLHSPKELFVHAWYDELVAALKGRNAARRSMVLDFWFQSMD